MTIQNAIARSVSHTEIVACEFSGDAAELATFVATELENTDDAVFSEENDGTIDVDNGDWRIRVTLIAE